MERARIFLILLTSALIAGLLAAAPIAPPPAAAADAAGVPESVSFSPFRAADTRYGTGVPAGIVRAGGVLQVPVAGRFGVPADVAAFMLNVTAVAPAGAGHLTVWTCGQPRPTTSTLNFPAGRTMANMALTAPDAAGAVCVYSNVQTHIIVDVSGYWPAGSKFRSLAPSRAADTRNATGVRAGIVPAQGVLQVPVTGRYGVPGDAAAVAVNVTAVVPTGNGHLTVWPCGTPMPNASNVNFPPGETTAAAALVKPGAGGAVCVFAQAPTHVVVDVVGFLAPGSAFAARVPVRVMDTRAAIGVPVGAIPAGHWQELPVAGEFGIPEDAGSVSVTVTVVAPTGGGHLTVFPCGAAVPTTSNANFVRGRTTAAAIIARLGDGGRLCVSPSVAAHIVVDVNGSYPKAEVGSGASAIDRCALMPGGYVRCWGYLSDVPLTVRGIVGATAISGRCAVVAGTVQCWGEEPRNGARAIAGVSGATALAVTDSHGCAIVAGGAVRCWGWNAAGQLGNGSTSTVESAAAVSVRDVSGATSLAVAGGSIGSAQLGHTCATVAGGAVKCWGWNAGGQLGDGTTVNRSVPVTAAGVSGARSLAAGIRSTCALSTSGTVSCWGSNASRPTAVAGISGATDISASDRTDAAGSDLGHVCAVTAGAVKCWGNNVDGQLGDGTTISRTVPQAAVGVTGATAVSAQDDSTCALRQGGSVTCWGYRMDLSTRRTPVAAGPASGITGLAAGGAHTCALTAGKVQCWGDDDAGQAQVPGAATFTPRAVSGVSGVRSISAGQLHTCAVTTGGEAYCWGNDSQSDPKLTAGALRLPGVTRLPISSVVAVGSLWSDVCVLQTGGAVRCYSGAGLSEVRTVIASGATALADSCAVMADRTARCWTDGPAVAVPGLTGVKSLSSKALGGEHSCAVLVDGSVRCWGSGVFGELGDGSWQDSTTPVGVQGISTAVAVSTGTHHSCALLADRTVRCWGANDSGQLGDRGVSGRTTPVPVVGLTGATGITAGGAHTCALVGGSAKCWGANSRGQSGMNPGWLPWGRLAAL